ncbi:MAG: ABC transporter substrate-binding protein [Alphaproteobacteria bacterium]|nr:ABC transporter substrate-binding protein [Alphaproteobacteria bacterium]
MRKIIAVLSLCFISASYAKTLTKEEQFINDLGNEIITLIRSTDDMAKKKEHFRGVLTKNFDMKSIGKFVLGRHWRQATDAQKQQFVELYEQSVVDTYTSQFNQYKNESMQVQNSRKDNDDGAIWVNTLVQGPARDPLSIRWKIYEVSGQLKIYDILVNEVSMGITHRSEYASIINSNGGNIDGLLKAMRENNISRLNN